LPPSPWRFLIPDRDTRFTDILMLLLPEGAGEAHPMFALANDPSLLGVSGAQSTPLAFDGTGAIVAVRGSNGLALTIGTL